MISFNHFSFSYKSHPVFSDLNLEFQPGRIYGLLGENGVGKTTLLKTIAGLLFPSKGECRVGEFVPSERAPEFLQTVAFLPDEVTLPDFSTPRAYFESVAPFYPKHSKGQFESLCQAMAVNPDANLKRMSLGQQKKSLLAVTFSLGADIILLDEPTNGLDIPSKQQFRSLLRGSISKEATVVIATHQVRDVEQLLDHIVILTPNSVLLDASVAQIRRRLAFEVLPVVRTDAFYYEACPGGFLCVSPNVDGRDTTLLVEPLFNAVTTNPNIQILFSNTDVTPIAQTPSYE